MQIDDILCRKARGRQLDPGHIDPFVFAERTTVDDDGLDLVAADVLDAQLKMPVVEQKRVPRSHTLRQIGVGRRYPLRIAHEIADSYSQGLASLQPDRKRTRLH